MQFNLIGVWCSALVLMNYILYIADVKPTAHLQHQKNVCLKVQEIVDFDQLKRMIPLNFDEDNNCKIVQISTVWPYFPSKHHFFF